MVYAYAGHAHASTLALNRAATISSLDMISQKRAFEIIEKGQADDTASRFCDVFLFGLIVINLAAVCLETVDELYAQYQKIFTIIEVLWPPNPKVLLNAALTVLFSALFSVKFKL